MADEDAWKPPPKKERSAKWLGYLEHHAPHTWFHSKNGKINKGAVANYTHVAYPTVQGWYQDESVPDTYHCLLIAQHLGLPEMEVLAAASHVPDDMALDHGGRIGLAESPALYKVEAEALALARTILSLPATRRRLFEELARELHQPEYR